MATQQSPSGTLNGADIAFIVKAFLGSIPLITSFQSSVTSSIVAQGADASVVSFVAGIFAILNIAYILFQKGDETYRSVETVIQAVAPSPVMVSTIETPTPVPAPIPSNTTVLPITYPPIDNTAGVNTPNAQ